MINTKNFLKNCDVNIYRENKTVNSRGGKDKVEEVQLYSLVACKIEMKEYDQPIDIAGKLYRKLYLIHLWSDANNVLIEPKENYIVEDPVNGKRYRILEVQDGSLHKFKPYKTESKAIVLNDSRFGNFDEPI